MILSIEILVIFIFFLLLWFQLPGMVIGRFLLPAKLSVSMKLLSEFFLGFTVMALVYALESLINLKGLLLICGPILSIVAIVGLVKDREVKYEIKHLLTFVIIFMLIFVTSIIAFQLAYFGADKHMTANVYHDYLFHTGNIASLSRSFPCDDIRVAGKGFYYHYFMELVFGMCKHIFGMSAFDLYINANSVLCAWPFALSLMIGGERLSRGRELSQIKYFILCAGSLFTCVGLSALNIGYFSNNAWSWADNHFVTNANALGLAFSLQILMFELIVLFWESEFKKRYVLLLFILMYTTSGFKGPSGALIVAITASVLVIESIINKRFSIQKLLYTIGITIGFLVAYVTVLVDISKRGSNNRETTFSTAGTLDRCAAAIWLRQYFHLTNDKLLHKIIMLIACTILLIGPLVIPYIAFLIRKLVALIKKKEIGDIYDWFAIGSVIIAAIGHCVITIEGISQAYMMLTSAYLIFYCAIRYMQSGKFKLINVCTCIVLFIGVGIYCHDLGYYIKFDNNQKQVYNTFDNYQGDLVSQKVIDGYKWIRDNTPKDSVLGVDIHTEGLDGRSIYFYAGAFSERQCYLEGYSYSDIDETMTADMLHRNEYYYAPVKELAETAYDESGIDYLVVTDRYYPDFEPCTDRLELVFANERIKVYQVL